MSNAFRDWFKPIPAIDYGGRIVAPAIGRNGGAGAFGDKRPVSATNPLGRHRGVDCLYRQDPPYRNTRPVYEGRHYCPSNYIPVIAAGHGDIWYAGWSGTRWSIQIDHHRVLDFGPLVTFYTHMAKVLVKKGDRVTAGQVIGIVGATGTDINHLHHEWWCTARGKTYDEWVVDPEPFLAACGFKTVAAPRDGGPGGSWPISGSAQGGSSNPPYPVTTGSANDTSVPGSSPSVRDLDIQREIENYGDSIGGDDTGGFAAAILSAGAIL